MWWNGKWGFPSADDGVYMQVQNLSGGELQRVALALCLGKPADVYLIDEPSAYLDSEQRLMAARVVKRWEARHNICLFCPFLNNGCTYIWREFILQIHSPCQENRVCCGARLHHGHLSCRPSNCVWWNPIKKHSCKHVSTCSRKLMFKIRYTAILA